jgi:hypothetical protein
MKTEKANYAALGSTVELDNDALYPLDFTKFKTVADIMNILSVIGFQFSPTHPEFDKIKHLINENAPQYPELQKFVDGETNPLYGMVPNEE